MQNENLAINRSEVSILRMAAKVGDAADYEASELKNGYWRCLMFRSNNNAVWYNETKREIRCFSQGILTVHKSQSRQAFEEELKRVAQCYGELLH